MIIHNFQNAEQIVRSLLKSLGYYKIELDNNSHKSSMNSFMIIADGVLRNIILEVKLEKKVGKQKAFSSSEIKKIKTYAATNHREAWSAVLKVNSRGEPTESIVWENLSK